MSATTAGRVEDEGACTRRQQPDRFVHQNGPVIDEFFPLLRFLFQHERAGREPNWSFEEQCVHPDHKPITLATCW